MNNKTQKNNKLASLIKKGAEAELKYMDGSAGTYFFFQPKQPKQLNK